MSIPVLNIRSLQPSKIRTILENFQMEQNQYEPQLIVLSKGKQIYRKRIKLTDLNRNSNCQKLNNSEEKIINLRDYEIDYSGESSKRYVKELFDKMAIFLTTGYLQLQQKYLMDLLYVMIVLDINKNWMDRLAASVHKKYYPKLWDVLILIYNNNFQRYFDHAMKLMQNNDEFLIDQQNQAIITKKFLQLKSVRQMQQFLTHLTYVLTFRGSEQVGAKLFHMMDVMYRYYLKSKGLGASDSEEKVVRLMGDKIGTDVMLKMKNVGMQQLMGIVKKKEQECGFGKLKREEDKQQLKQQIKNLQRQISQSEKTQSEAAYELQKFQRMTKLQGVNLAPSSPSQIFHHPECNACECPQSITLKCGHKNCVNCGFVDIQRYNIKPNRKIEEYNIRCLKGKDPANPCKEIWDSQRYQALGQMLSAFFS